MKPLFLTLLLFLTLQGFAQDSVSYSITGWHYESGITSMQVQFDFGWCVFLLDGNHVGDQYIMFAQGCNVVKRIGLYHFYPVPGLSYVTTKDEEAIKSALGLQTLCNR